ncbi:lactoperoxidase-like isoform X2 [Ambystoma mexicanum]|uniref:lactoperoxidase-like isoform X2 n=1 Tax=Ambystoma mexicanum TaxID=8296 RepID=UPI0037E75CC5
MGAVFPNTSSTLNYKRDCRQQSFPQRHQRMAGMARTALIFGFLVIVTQLPKIKSADGDGNVPRTVDDATILQATEEANANVQQILNARLESANAHASGFGNAHASSFGAGGGGSGGGGGLAGGTIKPMLVSDFASTSSLTATDLLGFFRRAAGDTFQEVRSGEAWQETFRKLNVHGVETKDGLYNLSVQLSESQLGLIAQRVNCIPETPVSRCPKKDQYRTVSGVCNNRKRSVWGSANRAFTRWLPAKYEDSVNLPLGWTIGKTHNGVPLPLPRKVSNAVFRYIEEKVVLDEKLSQLFVAWGQWLTHDVEFSPQGLVNCTQRGCNNEGNSFPVQVPSDDPSDNGDRKCMPFVRTGPACLANSVVRSQINGVTSFIDASTVYGSEECEVENLRDKSSKKGLLRVNKWITDHGRATLPYVNDSIDACGTGSSCIPPNPCRNVGPEHNVSCYITGDRRGSQNMGLLVMNTIFLRLHNWLTTKLNELNPHWDGEKLYEEARRTVGALHQIFSYRDYLSLLLGDNLKTELPLYDSYDQKMKPDIANVFTSAFRIPHTTVPPNLILLDPEYKPKGPNFKKHFSKTLFATYMPVTEGGYDPIIRGMLANEAKLLTHEEMMSDQLRDKLFAQNDATPGLDLAAFDIQRSRDHGIAGYNAWRKFCGLSQPKNENQLADVLKDKKLAKKLFELYRTAKNIDMYVGAAAEPFVKNGRVGDLLSCIYGKQFRNLRDGDRFWWQNEGVFTKKQRAALSTVTLSRLICDHTGLNEVPLNPFKASDYPRDFVKCSTLQKFDLSAWKEDPKYEECARPVPGSTMFHDGQCNN